MVLESGFDHVGDFTIEAQLTVEFDHSTLTSAHNVQGVPELSLDGGSAFLARAEILDSSRHSRTRIYAQTHSSHAISIPRQAHRSYRDFNRATILAVGRQKFTGNKKKVARRRRRSFIIDYAVEGGIADVIRNTSIADRKRSLLAKIGLRLDGAGRTRKQPPLARKAPKAVGRSSPWPTGVTHREGIPRLSLPSDPRARALRWIFRS